MYKMIRLICIIAILISTISSIVAQQNFKAGACPPPVSMRICDMTCRSDSQCENNYKCCRTECGGTVCTFPVTARARVSRVKPGNCPNSPTGRWVCSSTCQTDGDCRGRSKCCRNRCGALACTKPEA